MASDGSPHRQMSNVVGSVVVHGTESKYRQSLHDPITFPSSIVNLEWAIVPVYHDDRFVTHNSEIQRRTSAWNTCYTIRADTEKKKTLDPLVLSFPSSSSLFSAVFLRGVSLEFWQDRLTINCVLSDDI